MFIETKLTIIKIVIRVYEQIVLMEVNKTLRTTTYMWSKSCYHLFFWTLISLKTLNSVVFIYGFKLSQLSHKYFSISRWWLKPLEIYLFGNEFGWFSYTLIASKHKTHISKYCIRVSVSKLKLSRIVKLFNDLTILDSLRKL